MSKEKLETEVQALDREAKEALGRLADKREQLQRELAATELAEQHQREREEERRRAKTEEAERKAREESEARCERLRMRLSELSDQRKELAKEFRSAIEEYIVCHHELASEVRKYDGDEANRMATARIGMERRFLNDTFGDWMR